MSHMLWSDAEFLTLSGEMLGRPTAIAVEIFKQFHTVLMTKLNDLATDFWPLEGNRADSQKFLVENPIQKSGS